MSNSHDDLRWLTPRGEPIKPTEAERSAAEHRLREAIAAEKRWRHRRRRSLPLAVLLGAAALAAVIVSTLVPTPAQAILMEAARAARVAQAFDVPEGSFLFSHSDTETLLVRPGSDFGLSVDEVGYVLIGTRDVWRNREERFLQVRTTIDRVMFFDGAIENAYEDLGLAEEDGVGQTRTAQFTDVVDELVERDWPTTANELRAAMEAFSSVDVRPIEVRLLDLAADMLRETNPSPQFRAALLEVLAGLDYKVEDRQDSVLIKIDYEDGLAYQLAVEIDHAGRLVSESVVLLEDNPALGLAADTTISRAAYSTPVVVNELD